MRKDLDFELQDEGSIVLLRPLTVAATHWVMDNIGEEAQWFGRAVVIEPRYLGNILEGVTADGFAY